MVLSPQMHLQVSRMFPFFLYHSYCMLTGNTISYWRCLCLTREFCMRLYFQCKVVIVSSILVNSCTPQDGFYRFYQQSLFTTINLQSLFARRNYYILRLRCLLSLSYLLEGSMIISIKFAGNYSTTPYFQVNSRLGVSTVSSYVVTGITLSLTRKVLSST